jgi:hypothetical protein
MTDSTPDKPEPIKIPESLRASNLALAAIAKSMPSHLRIANLFAGDPALKQRLAGARLVSETIARSALAKQVAANDAHLRIASSVAAPRPALELPPTPKSGHVIVREGVDEVKAAVLELAGAVGTLTDVVGVLAEKSERSARILIWLTLALVVLGALTMWIVLRA